MQQPAANTGAPVPAWRQQQLNNQANQANQPKPVGTVGAVGAVGATTTPPPPANTAPSWANKNAASQPAAGGFGANKVESMKEKKDRQEKQRLQKQQKQKQEQERLERERLQKERQEQERQKEEERKVKEAKDIERQLRLMQLEEKISLEREKEDKIEDEKKKKKGGKAKPKASPQKSKPAGNKKTAARSDSGLSSQYLSAFNGLSEKFESYRDRLDNQKEILRLYAEFRTKCCTKLKQLVDQMGSSTQPRQTSLTDDGIHYVFGLGSSKLINGSSTFDMSEIKKLRRQLRLYDILQNCLLQLSKRIGIVRLRVPMSIFMEYRGVSCFASAVAEDEQDQPKIEIVKVREIAGDVELLEKEMQKHCPKFTSNALQCRKIEPDSDVYMVYLKESKTDLLEDRPPIRKQHLESMNFFSGPSLPPSYSLATRHLRKLSTEGPFREIVDAVLLAKTVNKIYRSCQGEVQELHLWNLVLSRDEQLWHMIRNVGLVQNMPQLGLLFSLIRVFSGISFHYDENVFSQGLHSVRQIQVKELPYTFQKLQFVQICQNYDKYLKEGKLQLAGQSILLRTEMTELSETVQRKNALVMDHAQLLILQQKYEEAAEELNRIVDEVPKLSLERIRLLSLMVKTYSLLGREIDLLQNFEKLLTQISFNMGEDSHLHISLYSVLAHFYSTRRLSESVNLYQLALGIATKLYGQSSPQVGDIFIDLAKTYTKHNKLDEADYHLEQALKTYSDNRVKMAEVMTVGAKVQFLKGNKKQATQKIDKVIKIMQKLPKPQGLFEAFSLKLSFSDSLSEKYRVIDSMLDLGLSYGSRPIVKKAFELALKEELPKVSKAKKDRLLQIHSDEYANSPLLPGGQLDHHRKNFLSVCELLRWAFGLLDSSGGPSANEKAQLIFSDVIGHFTQEELTGLLSS